MSEKKINSQAAQKKDAQEIGNEPPGQGIDFTVEGIMNLSTATWFLSLFSFTPLPQEEERIYGSLVHRPFTFHISFSFHRGLWLIFLIA